MKHLFIAVFILTLINKTFGQHQVKIQESALLCATAYKTNDYTTIIKFTYPKLIEFMGGSDSFISIIKESINDLNKKGIQIDKVGVGKPGEEYQAGNEIHCLVPELLKLKVKGGFLLSQSFLLAVSANKGDSWFFVDIGNLPPERLKELFPDFNSNLIIPAPTKPIMYKDSVK